MSRKHFLRVFTQPFRRLYGDEVGALISAELAMVGTLGVLATAVGLESVSTSVNQELNDFGNAISSLDQSFSVRSLSKPGHSRVGGACFNGGANRGNRSSQLSVSEICGASTGGEGGGGNGLSGLESPSGAYVVESVGVESLGASTLEAYSVDPVTIQEVLVPKTTSVTVTFTDSAVVSQSVTSHSRCATEQGGRVIDERIVNPDEGIPEPPPLLDPKTLEPIPHEKAQPVPQRKSAPIPMPKATTSKAASAKPVPAKAAPKVAPKATPKTQIPKPQADR